MVWPAALECMYVVDLGVTEFADEEGDLLGSARSGMYGATIDVPEVGPVASHERRVLIGDGVLQEPAHMTFESRNTLVAQGPAGL